MRYVRWNAAFIGENAFSRKFTNDPLWNQKFFTHSHRFVKSTHECQWFQASHIGFHQFFRYIGVQRWSAHTVHMFSSVMRRHRWSSVILQIHHAWKSVPSDHPGSPVVSTVCHAWSLIIRCHRSTTKARLLPMWLYQFLLVSACFHTSVLQDLSNALVKTSRQVLAMASNPLALSAKIDAKHRSSFERTREVA